MDSGVKRWGYNNQPWNRILQIHFFMASVFVFCLGVFLVLKGYPAYLTGFSTSCSLPFHPYFSLLSSPFLLSLLTPLCPFWLDSTQALYATCPSARLYLREPQSLSLELPLLGFMRCPPSSLLCVSLTPSCFLLLPAVLYKYRHTHTQQ